MNSVLSRLAGAFAVLIMTIAAPALAQPVSNPQPGVHVIGKGATKLTEYVSYTCPHCAHFEEEGGEALRSVYASTDKLQIVVRHLVRDPFDLTAAMLTNCGAATKFNRNHSLFMREQRNWLGKLVKATQAQRNRYDSGSYTARRRAIAQDAGFYDMMRTLGYQRAEVDKCLADEAMAAALAEKTKSYVDLGVRGTPSFAVDDVLLAGTSDWQSLKFQLDLRL
ncbi:DsbA family protein [Croceicoccus sediminis]|uniref:DsbA family protein n=1 Tax=Croceicoccus sediminis TaxID=2571150 RepID=UPI001182CD23|nr:thioredoxin domain-containing protein [Croceicoccus sediminis]